MSPFHPGELDVQRRMGVEQKLAPFAARAIRPFLPEQHREFFRVLPFLLLTARGEGGLPIITTISGPPGFIQSPSPTLLTLDRLPPEGDPLFGQLQQVSDVGLLGIQLHTRRRNRANCVASSLSNGRLELRVLQSFGNCSQYITERTLGASELGTLASEKSPILDARSAQLIQKSDTFFIGSGVEGFGLDASHRGGPTGFVHVTSPRTVVFPDYSGNNFFNTIGNLTRDPRIALLFIDFVQGHLLHVFGQARIDWDSPAVEEFPDAARLIHVDIAESIFRENAWGLTTSSRTD